MKIIYVFCIIFIVSIILYFNCGNIDIYTIKSVNPGPKILLISGTHGNEPSGFMALLRLQNAFKKNSLKLKLGELTIIHNTNPCGYYFDSRHYNTPSGEVDLNRMYSKGHFINSKIEKIVNNYDIILDFHEGWGYINNNDGSIGSSIQPINILFKSTSPLGVL